MQVARLAESSEGYTAPANPSSSLGSADAAAWRAAVSARACTGSAWPRDCRHHLHSLHRCIYPLLSEVGGDLYGLFVLAVPRGGLRASRGAPPCCLCDQSKHVITHVYGVTSSPTLENLATTATHDTRSPADGKAEFRGARVQEHPFYMGTPRWPSSKRRAAMAPRATKPAWLCQSPQSESDRQWDRACSLLHLLSALFTSVTGGASMERSSRSRTSALQGPEPERGKHKAKPLSLGTCWQHARRRFESSSRRFPIPAALRCLSLQLFVHGAEPLIGLLQVEVREVANHLQGAPRECPGPDSLYPDTRRQRGVQCGL